MAVFCAGAYATTDIQPNGNVAGGNTAANCTQPVLGTYSGSTNFEAKWRPNDVQLRWYNETTRLTVQDGANTCSYDGTLNIPATPPNRTGYVFGGWKVVSKLPAAYTELQYLESNGSQWIDTGVSGFNTGNWEIYVKWMITGWASNYGYVLGVYSNENTNSYRVILQNTDNNGYYVSANSKAGGGSIALTNKPKNEIHTATLRNNSFEFDGQTYSAPTTGTTLPSTSTMFLFASSTGLKTKSRIYSTWARKDNVLVYGMIPARRNSDNVLGMYDVVSGTFLTNAGSGTFTAGPDLN